ncbi:hypothetical protein CXG81DRAFT_25403 [Caulochytrium protostelioides]|uniref:Uncharacterized protein n=1 Tax=Caulochytrium protostelioides TaxID=1555241 RepID=A0A4P9X9E3_9FUNG|nr:hypothetical protein CAUPRSCDRAFT_11502 [Caulochytrium protostelioides]RKP01912.1 hypothetical protein CXG81DRAFT_25403 [Caulochytrium protostelioides]|eukprot:RKP01912.1 hypothetical protein CXG81DRAFT_25403 [Caulochytrium protostelioides]
MFAPRCARAFATAARAGGSAPGPIGSAAAPRATPVLSRTAAAAPPSPPSPTPSHPALNPSSPSGGSSESYWYDGPVPRKYVGVLAISTVCLTGMCALLAHAQSGLEQKVRAMHEKMQEMEATLDYARDGLQADIRRSIEAYHAAAGASKR